MKKRTKKKEKKAELQERESAKRKESFNPPYLEVVFDHLVGPVEIKELDVFVSELGKEKGCINTHKILQDA